jgi:6-phosphogluconolactonase (cycloisomerase 2 family)
MSHKFPRRHAAQLILLATAFAAAWPAHADDRDDDDDHGAASYRVGKMFISTNAPAGNEVLVYQRAGDTPATLLARVPTQGRGTGAGLGSQGAVTLSRDGKYLFVVNAASNNVSTFAVKRRGLELTSIVDTGGVTPTSVTESDGLVYVLNAGGSGDVVGFRNRGGTLTPIASAIGTLSATTGTAPGQVGLNEDGDVLVVTERATQRITSFRVKRDGTLTDKTVSVSSGQTPFGFAFTTRDVLVVSEATRSGVSSYRFADRSAVPNLVTASLPNGQGAACWIAVTPNGKFAFSANAATSSVSSFAVARDGQLSLVAGAAAVTGPNAGALDMAVSPSGRQLNVFASRGLQIVSYRIASDGSLSLQGTVGGMPAGSAGLAAN